MEGISIGEIAGIKEIEKKSREVCILSCKIEGVLKSPEGVVTFRGIFLWQIKYLRSGSKEIDDDPGAGRKNKCKFCAQRLVQRALPPSCQPAIVEGPAQACGR